MKAIIFSGPSLPRALVETASNLEWRPPAKQGDVYKAVLSHPHAIGLVDGFFETVPAVWHKEILWAMTQRIHVYGAASIGALRAAELAPFGMKGVGRVFELFRNGTLQDDDEVAILHGPEELGYTPVTEAMVNLRATLERATEQRILGPETADALISIAKSLFYKERSYDTVLGMAAEQGVDNHGLCRLKEWLPTNSIDQKRVDATAMLERIQADLSANLCSADVAYRFAHTAAWEAAIQNSAGEG